MELRIRIIHSNDPAEHPHEKYIRFAEETGRWWENPWWEGEGCEIHFSVPLEEMRRATGVLREHFDADWYLDLAKAPRRNLVFPYLCLERSTKALEFIASLGATIERLRGSPNLERAIRALRKGRGEGALLELETAECFTASGFRVSFPKETNERSYDILAARDGLAVAIECKRLELEQWRNWERSLQLDISSCLPSHHRGAAIAVQVHLDEGLIDVRYPDAGENKSELRRHVTAAIKAAVATTLESNTVPAIVRLPDVATIAILPASDKVSSYVCGINQTDEQLFRRIFRSGVFKALRQLPPQQPGLIVVYSQRVPAKSAFRQHFDALLAADGQRFANVVGVLVCSLQTWFQRTPPVFYGNTKTVQGAALAIVTRVLEDRFGALSG